MKRTYNIGGRDVEFTEVWATIEGERLPRVLVHDTADEWHDGDGILGDLESLPETDAEAADALINEHLETYTAGMGIKPRETKMKKMKQISINNGRTYMTAEEAVPEILESNLWPVVEQVMDDDTREAVHRELAPCTEAEFLARYLEIAPHDLIIG